MYETKWVIKTVKEYIYSYPNYGKPIDDFRLNRELNYLIQTACRRLYETFGEVTKKDLVLLTEAWIIKSHKIRGPQALVHKSTPVNEE